jgi:hypothetical protein
MSVAAGDAWPRSSRSLLGTIVRSSGVDVGRVVDIIFDRRFTCAVGLAVDEHGARSSFLPWATARMGFEAIDTWAPFSLLGNGELDLYLEHGARLTAALHMPGPGGAALTDVFLDRAGSVASLAMETTPAEHDAPSATAEVG